METKINEMESKVVFVERVSYGKESTPVELREYKIVGTNGPVGTIDEWINMEFKPIVEERGDN